MDPHSTTITTIVLSERVARGIEPVLDAVFARLAQRGRLTAGPIAEHHDLVLSALMDTFDEETLARLEQALPAARPSRRPEPVVWTDPFGE